MPRHRAFTLIELLIVVAIIAILAAIAVPNFLEAQVRSKVARVRSDMRSIATAMEAYAVDYNRYPTPSDGAGNLVPNPVAATGVNPMETRVPVLLTTPIAYMSSRPFDPFSVPGEQESNLYHAITHDYLQIRQNNAPTVNWNTVWFRYFRDMTGEFPPDNIAYLFVSFGPDKIHDAAVPHVGPSTGPHEHGSGALYDPTNGTISSGDILYFGPGRGFWYQK